MSKKIKYSLDTEFDDFNFLLFGISTTLDQYSVITQINNLLNIEFCLQSVVPYYLKGNSIFNYNLYTCNVPELFLEFNLIANLSNFETTQVATLTNDLFAEQAVEERARLIKELPKTDYFIIVKGEQILAYENKILEKLKQVNDFTQIQQIQPFDLKNASHLIF
ncbi:MAG: IPExxxVDY family protein [Bacteroidetes bacterium]|nr:IPExxxVDY family protein [Bacteroidota bacterium]